MSTEHELSLSNALQVPRKASPVGAVLRGPNRPIRDFSLIAGFQKWARQSPENTAIIDGDRQVSYGVLDRQTNQWARVLRARGVGPGVTVGIALERSVELIVSLLAVVKAGGAYVPLDPDYPAARLELMLKKVRPRLVLTLKRFTGRFAVPEGTSLLCLDEPDALSGEISAEAVESAATAEDPLYVIFTSGSTGEPKGAMVQRRGFANLLEWFEDEFFVGEKDRFLLLSSPSFDLTQKNFFVPLRCGGTLVCYPPGPFDLTRLAAMIERHGMTVMNCTPSAFYPLVDPFTEAAAARLATLRLAVLGGEPILLPRVRSWLEQGAGRAEIANTYGPTECTDICGFYRLSRANLDAFPFVPLGGTIPNVQIAVADDTLAINPPGEAGELIIGGMGVGLGYIGDAARTDERFVPNPQPELLEGPKIYRTGDRVRLLPQGVLEFLGRVDHQVKLRGFRIELPEIEAALASHGGVREAAVVLRSEEIAAFYVPQAGAMDPAELRAFLGQLLPSHMIPQNFAAVDALPLTPNGKVDRLRLAQKSARQRAVPESDGATGLESRLREIWTGVLEREDVGWDENFFDLGGDSIQLARVHAQVAALIGRALPITDLFAHTTLRTLARHLSKDGPAPENTAVRQRASMQRAVLARRPVRS